jgi:hypothetical protein
MGKVTGVDTNGRYTPPKNAVVKPIDKNHSEAKLDNGTVVRTNANHQVTSITSPTGARASVNPKTGNITAVSKVNPDGTGVRVAHSPSGVRQVESVSKDSQGRTVHTVARGTVVYREREIKRNGITYHERTVLDRNHQTHAVVYRDHVYGKYGTFPVYVAPYYYQPAFYGYVDSPWGASVTFGWSSSPWYGSYGMYFAPANVYPSPTVWMTDYVISANLQTAYAAQQPQPGDQPDQAEPQSAPTAPIPPAVREEYHKEVQTEVENVKAEAEGHPAPETVPGALNPLFPVIQSYSDVQVENVAGGQCAITGGDFVRHDDNVLAADRTILVTVVSVAKSTESHCAKDDKVRLSVDTLQDWFNSFMEDTQKGFQAMVQQQGKNGFPPATGTTQVANKEGEAVPDAPEVVENSAREANTNASSAQAEVQTSGGQ